MRPETFTSHTAVKQHQALRFQPTSTKESCRGGVIKEKAREAESNICMSPPVLAHVQLNGYYSNIFRCDSVNLWQV